MKKKVMELRGISKTFPGVKALDNVSFDLYEGEVHALVGENGAGKSTLMNILSGVYQPNEGEIYLNDNKVHFIDPKDAQEKGVSMIHQELALAPSISVMENIFIGRLKRNRFSFVDYKTMRRECKYVLTQYKIGDVRPDDLVKNLSVSHMQLVEIAKALYLKNRIIIMDEPTSSLTKAETDTLFSHIQSLRKSGMSIIYISHRLEEIKEIADRVTVLRDGQYIDTLNNEDADIPQIVSLMVGREFDRTYKRECCCSDEIALKVSGLTNKKLKDIHFELRRGEVLGLTGLVGAGRTELVEAIFGEDKYDAGEIYVGGEKVEISCPADAINTGIGLIPEGRKTQGLCLNLDVQNNITLVKRKDYTTLSFINSRIEKTAALGIKNQLDIKTPSLSQKIKYLSGGNQQKAIIGRWLLNRPKILFLDEPTHGIDVGAKKEIYKLVSTLAQEGVSIILISSEMSEVMMLSDRIMVMHDGRITGILDKAEVEPERIMAYATNQY